jgi:hypothetical protein
MSDGAPRGNSTAGQRSGSSGQPSATGGNVVSTQLGSDERRKWRAKNPVGNKRGKENAAVPKPRKKASGGMGSSLPRVLSLRLYTLTE